MDSTVVFAAVAVGATFLAVFLWVVLPTTLPEPDNPVLHWLWNAYHCYGGADKDRVDVIRQRVLVVTAAVVWAVLVGYGVYTYYASSTDLVQDIDVLKDKMGAANSILTTNCKCLLDQDTFNIASDIDKVTKYADEGLAVLLPAIVWSVLAVEGAIVLVLVCSLCWQRRAHIIRMSAFVIVVFLIMALAVAVGLTDIFHRLKDDLNDSNDLIAKLATGNISCQTIALPEVGATCSADDFPSNAGCLYAETIALKRLTQSNTVKQLHLNTTKSLRDQDPANIPDLACYIK